MSILMPEALAKEELDILAVKASDLDDDYVQQLVHKSRQPHVRKFEEAEDIGTLDAPGRFRTINDYHEWAQGKERFMFLLLGKNRSDSGAVQDVGGVAWFGAREHPKAPGRSVTFAMRTYAADEVQGWGQYVGRGLAVPFMVAVHEATRETYPNEGLWLDLVDGNHASQNMCLRAGYEEVTRHNDETHGGQSRIVMANDTAFR